MVKLKNLQEAKYADPKLEHLKRFLTNDFKPKENYLIIFHELGENYNRYIVSELEFGGIDEEGEYIGVEFESGDSWVSYNPKYFLDNIKIYQMKQVL